MKAYPDKELSWSVTVRDGRSVKNDWKLKVGPGGRADIKKPSSRLESKMTKGA